VLVHKPLYWIGKDLGRDGRYALQHDYHQAWYDVDNKVVPNLIAPDDTFGLLFQWPGLRLGIERRSTANSPSVSYRSFVNNIYNTGFYRDGDPLGEALGGEADFTTLRLECDFTSRLSGTFWLIRGYRPFRDDAITRGLSSPRIGSWMSRETSPGTWMGPGSSAPGAPGKAVRR